MAITTDEISGWVRYVPSVMGNELDDDPCSVDIHPMSHAEVKAYERSFINAPKALAKGVPSEISKLEKRIEAMLSKRVRNVINLRWRGQNIVTGAQFAQYAPSELITDVVNAITDISHLSEALKNGCGWVLDSSRAGTQPSIGGADDVADLQTSEG